MNRCFKPCVHSPFKISSSSSDLVVSPDYSFLVSDKKQSWYIRFWFWFKHFIINLF